MRYQSTRALGAIGALVLLLDAAPAHGDSDFEFNDTLALKGWTVMTSVIGALGGGVALVGNSVYLGMDERAGAGWAVSGVVFGAVNCAAAGLWFAQADDSPTFEYSMGSLWLALGVADVTLAFLARALPPEETPALSLVHPFVLRERDGSTYGGLSFELGF